MINMTHERYFWVSPSVGDRDVVLRGRQDAGLASGSVRQVVESRTADQHGVQVGGGRCGRGLLPLRGSHTTGRRKLKV